MKGKQRHIQENYYPLNEIETKAIKKEVCFYTFVFKDKQQRLKKNSTFMLIF